MSDTFERLKAALADRYAIEHELGSGGMATVYLAEDLKHERKVAVKVLRPDLAAALGSERFLREIKIAAQLHHPHILPLHDSGEAHGFLYYVMPFVEGESLRDRLNREKQLPLDDALQIAREVADALGSAHSHDVVHRDVKPENILLEEGHAVVADFGIARAITAAGGEQLTETGLAIGTPAYMSPEQAAGGAEIDGRSDLYSLACVVYEMLAGEPPYTGPTPQAVFAKRLSEPVPHVSTLRETVPKPVEQTITRALAKAPADRFPTAAQFAEALAVVEAAPVAVPAKPKRNLMAYAAIAILAIIGAYTIISRTLGPSESAAAAETPKLAVIPFSNLGSSADDYFADGITEEITSRIAEISGLHVISRTSAIQYKNHKKTLRQIGEELSVDYVLEGTIRTDRSPDGSGQVRVTPQLIRVSDDAHLWTDRYTADLVTGEIFRLQAEIAEQVAGALDVTLLEPERLRLAAKPTDDLEAWEYYVQGKSFLERAGTRYNLLAVDMYERAIARDGTFALAWAGISFAYSSAYQGSGAAEHLTKAHAALDRAFDLEPNLPEAHDAPALYHYVQGHYEQALEVISKVLRGRPSNAAALQIRGLTLRRLGRWEEALEAQTRAFELDPASTDKVWNLAFTHLHMRNYAEAERYFERQLRLDTELLGPRLLKAWVHIVRDGSVERAEEILREASQLLGVREVVEALVDVHPTYLWFGLLGENFSKTLETMSAGMFFARPYRFYLARADAQTQAGEPELASAYYDSMRVVLEQWLPAAADNPAIHGLLGVAYAGLGQGDSAIAHAERNVALRPVSLYPFLPTPLQYLARVYVMVGEYEAAIDQLEILVAIPSVYSVAWLRIHPLWEPLRGHPRFQRLLAKYEN